MYIYRPVGSYYCTTTSRTKEKEGKEMHVWATRAGPTRRGRSRTCGMASDDGLYVRTCSAVQTDSPLARCRCEARPVRAWRPHAEGRAKLKPAENVQGGAPVS